MRRTQFSKEVIEEFVKDMNIKNIGDLRKNIEGLDNTTPIFLGTWNGYSDTYTLADHIHIVPYEEIENDFFGTRGKMDKRVFNKHFLDKNVLFIGSIFHRNVDNEEIDFPDEPNEPIELINGQDGDHDLFWKSNGFELNCDKDIGDYWEFCGKSGDNNYSIQYYKKEKKLHVLVNNGQTISFVGDCVGLEDYFDIMKACKIDKVWRIG